MIALQLSEDRISFTERRNQIISGLHALPAQIKKVLELDSALEQLATTVSENKSLLLMGRGYQCAILFLFVTNQALIAPTPHLDMLLALKEL